MVEKIWPAVELEPGTPRSVGWRLIHRAFGAPASVGSVSIYFNMNRRLDS